MRHASADAGVGCCLRPYGSGGAQLPAPAFRACGLFGLMRVEASVRTDCAEALHEAALSGL